MKNKLLISISLSLIALGGCNKSSSTSSTTTNTSITAGRTVATVRTKFESSGYTVESQTISGISTLVGIKSSDAITILFYSSETLAIQAKPTYDTAASMVGQTCKRDIANIYYGTASAIAVYESLIN